MKTILDIPNNCGFCKDCFNIRKNNSAYCGKCEGARIPIYIDDQANFPLLKEAKKKFPIDTNIVFTYGNTIYGRNLDYGLVCHELTHVTRQLKEGVDIWWEKYLSDVDFRIKEELLAYKNQYEAYYRNDIEFATLALNDIARILSGPLYAGNISNEDVKKLILKK